MIAPPNLEKGQSSTIPPHFNGQYYGWVKNSMHDYIYEENSELWDIILDGPYVLMKEVKDGNLITFVIKTKKDFTKIDRKKYKKNYKA